MGNGIEATASGALVSNPTGRRASLPLLGETSDSGLLFFRRFLAFKVGSPLLFPYGFHQPLSLPSLCAIAAIPIACRRRHYWPGLLFLLGVAIVDIRDSWPFTLNHVGLEALILLLLILDAGPHDPNAVRVGEMVKGLMVSIWLYSGLQKLVHGFYTSGEYFALTTLSGEGKIGHHLEALFHSLERLVGSRPFQPLACCTDGPLLLSAWEVVAFRAMGLLTLGAELLLPFTLFFPKTRRAGIALLFVFQALVAVSSGEIDFAFTAFAILLLFTPTISRPGYTVLALGYTLWYWGLR